MKIFLYDIAREQSWCAAYWRRILPDLRALGYEQIALYVEQRYHFRSFPQHRPSGGITPAQAAEAQRLCDKHGLTLQWATNVLGHCDGLLANEAFRHLAEDISEGEQLCPSHPATRPFLRTMLREFAPMNRGQVWIVGGDEARALNRCARCRKRGLNDAELYLDHMGWVIRETKRLGKRPAIAGDMLLKYPRLIPEIDRDTIILDWHYDSGSADTIRLFHKHGFEVIATTSSNEFWRTLYPFDQVTTAIEPFMREARELKCAGICMTAWEMCRGTLMDNHWEHNAAAVAAYEGERFGSTTPLTLASPPRGEEIPTTHTVRIPLPAGEEDKGERDSVSLSSREFAKRFYGSPRADYQRLRRCFGESDLRKLHPFVQTAHIRRQFGRTESAYLFYHTLGRSRVRRALQQLATRIKPARRVVRDIQRSATKRQFYLEFLDLPLDLLEVMHDRVETLDTVRDAAVRLHPHRLSAAAGTRILRNARKRIARHLERCEKLASRYDRLADSRGGSQLDAHRLRRQIGELRTLQQYVSYHANTYAQGVDVPSRELWYV